jgi:DNA-binding IclR family transcriptional regulator
MSTRPKRKANSPSAGKSLQEIDPSLTALARYRVPILDRTLDFIELLARQPEGLTLTGLTDGLKIPKNTVFRIASTLALRGYVERDEENKSYRISRKILALGHTALGGDRLLQVSAPVLASLRNATGETALIGTLAGSHGVVLDQVPSLHPVKVVVELGHAFPLHSAAPAKAMLAFLDPLSLARLESHLTFVRFTPHTITTQTEYARALQEVRTVGYALDQGEESESFRCAAAPVFDHHGHPVAALWISGPVDRLSPTALLQAAEAVKEHASRLTSRLGGSFPAACA